MVTLAKLKYCYVGKGDSVNLNVTYDSLLPHAVFPALLYFWVSYLPGWVSGAYLGNFPRTLSKP